MESFFVCQSKQLKVLNAPDETFLYNNGAMIVNRTLEWQSRQFSLPVGTRFFLNMRYDFFIVSNEQRLYRFNKYKEELVELGQIVDEILDIFTDGDVVVLLSDKEMMLFDKYFVLSHSVAFDPSEVAGHSAKQQSASRPQLAWAAESFYIYGWKKAVGFNMKLERINSIEGRRILSMVYIARYNKFACVTDSCDIQFIEPNGLKHGEPINHRSGRVDILKVDDSELLVSSDIAAGTATAFFMKNFQWYRKLELEGEVVCCEENSIIIRHGGVLVMHFIQREFCHRFVVDGARLNYTNMHRALIPPPFYYKQLCFPQQIQRFCHTSGRVLVLSGHTLYDHTITTEDSFLLTNSFEIANSANIPGPHGISEIHDLLLIGDSPIVRQNNEFFLLTPNGPEPYTDKVCGAALSQALKMDKNIIRAYMIHDILAVLFSDGEFWLDGQKYEFSIDPRKSSTFHWFKDIGESSLQELHASGISRKMESIEIRDSSVRLGLLCNGTLQYYNAPGICHTVPDKVVSFIFHENFLIYTTKNQLVTASTTDNSTVATAYVDAGTNLLTVVENRVVSQTLFGSLETTTSKPLSRLLIAKLLKSGQYGRAALECHRNNVSYEIFFDGGICPIDVVDQLDNQQLCQLISVLDFPRPVLHEFDSLSRLKRAFSTDLVYGVARQNLANTADSNTGEITLSDYDRIIRSSSIQHLFCREYPLPPVAVQTDTDACLAIQKGFLSVERPIESLNLFLGRLDARRHLSVLVDLFMMIGRPDFCFYLPETDKSLNILAGRVSSHDIVAAAARTHSLENIEHAHRACHLDATLFADFCQSRKNLEFAISDYFQDRSTALFYLVRDTERQSEGDTRLDSTDVHHDVADYVQKYDLRETALLLQYYGLCRSNFYGFVAATEPPPRAFVLLIRGGDRQAALRLAEDHLLWREALSVLTRSAIPATANFFIDRLRNHARYSEAAEIYEEYLQNANEAIALYVDGNAFGRALTLYEKHHLIDRIDPASTGDTSSHSLIQKFQTGIVRSLRSTAPGIAEAVETYEKYKNRLRTVRERLEENASMSQSTFSCTSRKSARNALSKDRPGGAYEHEYILNKIATTMGLLARHGEQLLDIQRVCVRFGLDNEMEICSGLLCQLAGMGLNRDIDELWNYEHPEHDTRRPVVARPTIPSFGGSPAPWPRPQ